ELLKRHGAKGVLMSGSGSTVFGLFSDLQTARDACSIRRENKEWRIHLGRMPI
ncbi:MAG: hypothetical protein HQK66_12730, partial [Desulfamplus sp.]|nr:hypothetical protein [Desulfamplus sp.]